MESTLAAVSAPRGDSHYWVSQFLTLERKQATFLAFSVAVICPSPVLRASLIDPLYQRRAALHLQGVCSSVLELLLVGSNNIKPVFNNPFPASHSSNFNDPQCLQCSTRR